MYVLPIIPSDGRYEFTTVLDGITCGFDVYWNASDGAWYFHFYDEKGLLVAAGVKVVLGIPLARRVDHVLFDRGALVAVDTTDSGTEAGFDDFGVRVELRYYTEAEVIAGMQAES